MKYKAVIFDLYGTLVSNKFGSDNSLKEMAEVLSAPEKEFANIWNAGFKKRMTGEYTNFQDCVENVCRELKLPATRNQIEIAANIRFNFTRQEMLSPQTLAVETISQLKTKVQKIGLLSNCSAETIIVWDETPFKNIIDITVFSCATGLMKPDPRIFHIALEKLQVKPGECLYIADGMDGELKAAAAVGMTPVRISFPHANKNDPYLEDWHGATITSLKEVLDLVK